MSWKGFTKAVARLPQQIGRVAGYASDSKDENYDLLEESVKGLETYTKLLYEDARKFKDSMGLMLAHQSAAAATFKEAYQPIGITDSESAEQLKADYATQIALTEKLSESSEQLKENLSADLDMIERLVIAPTGDLITLLESVKRVMTKRAHKKLDYDRHKDSVTKLKDRKDRTAADEKRLGQLEGSFAEANRDFSALDNQLKQDLPSFLNLRVEFITPIMYIFYACQLRLYQYLYSASYDISGTQFKSYRNVIEDYESKGLLLEEILVNLTIPKRGAKRLNPDPSDSSVPGSVPSSVPGSVPGSLPAGSLPASTSQSGVSTFATPIGSSAANAPISRPVNQPPFKKAPPVPKQVPTVTALYDFVAQAEGDLSFKRGDRIEIVNRTQDVNDWWTGKLNGATGSFPGNYVSDP